MNAPVDWYAIPRLGPGDPMRDSKERPKHGGASRRGSHRLASVAKCELLWDLRYNRALRLKVDKEYRADGTLCHSGFAYHWASRLPEEHRPLWFSEQSLGDAVRDEAAWLGYDPEEKLELVVDITNGYRAYYMRDPWSPVFVEEEFSATVGELDPRPGKDGEEPPNPELDNKIVTCRVDLVVEYDGGLWVVDHKTQGGRWGAQGLEKWQDDGEWTIDWQAMFNLHVLRKRFGAHNVRGFIIQRVRRKRPFDADRHVLTIPKLLYPRVPREVRLLVRDEEDLLVRIGRGEKPRVAAGREGTCYHRYGPCDYIHFCGADSKAKAREILRKNFRVER